MAKIYSFKFTDWAKVQNYAVTIYDVGNIIVCNDAFVIPGFSEPSFFCRNTIEKCKDDSFNSIVSKLLLKSPLQKYALCRFGKDAETGEFFEFSTDHGDDKSKNKPIIIASSLEQGLISIDSKFFSQWTEQKRIYVSDLISRDVKSVLFTRPDYRGGLYAHFLQALLNGTNEQLYIDAIAGLNEFAEQQRISLVLIYHKIASESLEAKIDKKLKKIDNTLEKINETLRRRGIQLS